MNKLSLLIIICLAFIGSPKAQVLNVTKVTQEQNQWCWAGVSKCILNYYGNTIDQCTIVDYTRNTATWHSFGSQPCCQYPYGECNYWNYNWGYPGSIQDVLVHFGNIQNYGKSNNLTTAEISTELGKKHPFVIRWAWTNGGGHFIVGHGLQNESLYYMDPWPGEGSKIALYSWVVANSDHSWKGTNIMTTDPTATAISSTEEEKQVKIYPNPSTGMVTVEINSTIDKYSIEVVSTSNQRVLMQEYQSPTAKATLDLTSQPNGIYVVKVKSDSVNETTKILISK